MRNKELIIWAIVGFAAGLACGFGVGGPSDLGVAVAFGFLFAAMFPLFAQMSKSARLRPTEKRKVRSQARGSFQERLERFSENVDDADSCTTEKPKMALWTSSETEEYSRTPPKPIGIIRFLLKRIKKVLAGNKG